MSVLKIATLFSGVGTPEQSLKHLNINHETIFACEIDKYARQTYLANNQEPNTFYEDVYNIDGKKYLNQIDILIGGSPCQSFSIAGKRLGVECPRGNLIYEYFRIVEESKPKVFIYENVKGFLSIDKGETFKNFVQSFKDIGYTVYHQVLNTKDYGVPQNRERIYIVGFKDNIDFEFQEKQELKLRLKDMLEDNVDNKYLLSEKLVSYFEKHKQEQDKKGNGFGWSPLGEEDDISFTITNPGKCRPNETYIKLNQTHTLNIKGNDSIKRIYSADGLCPSLTTMQGGHREPKVAINVIGVYNKPFMKRVNNATVEINKFLKDNKGSYSLREISEKTEISKTTLEHYFRIDKSRATPNAEDWIKLKKLLNFDDTFDKIVTEYKEDISTFESSSRVYGIEGLAPCITSVNADKYIAGQVGLLGGVQKDSYVAIANNLIEVENNQVVFNEKFIFRKLTERECFRLQGFDDNFIFPPKMSSSQLYKQAGNGMSRNVLDMIFTQIFKYYKTI